MSVKLKFQMQKATADGSSSSISGSSLHSEIRAISRAAASIEAKTLEIRNTKATGIYTTYAKGRTLTQSVPEISSSSNSGRNKD